MHLPVTIGDFTDFSCAKEHNLNAGEMVMGKRFLPPAFHSYPLGYQGRASSIMVSDTPIERPVGQFKDKNDPDQKVITDACRALDFELEVGAIVGKPVGRGQRLKAEDADEHIFGFVIVNDWSGESESLRKTNVTSED